MRRQGGEEVHRQGEHHGGRLRPARFRLSRWVFGRLCLLRDVHVTAVGFTFRRRAHAQINALLRGGSTYRIAVFADVVSETCASPFV